MKASIFAPNRTIVERDKIDTLSIEIYVHSPSQLKYNVAGLNLTFLSLLHRQVLLQNLDFSTVTIPMVYCTTFYFRSSQLPYGQLYNILFPPSVNFLMVNFQTFYFSQQSTSLESISQYYISLNSQLSYCQFSNIIFPSNSQLLGGQFHHIPFPITVNFPIVNFPFYFLKGI